MTSDFKIFRSGKLLIEQHGKYATLEAAILADRLRDLGDMEGANTWKRIMRAIEELQRIEKGPGETAH